MKATDLSPTPVGPIRFTGWRQISAAPRDRGCYVIATIDGDILYIGQATRIGDRMKDHLADGKKRKRAPDGVAYWFFYLTREKKSQLNALEGGWVHQYQQRHGGEMPPFNDIMPPMP